MTVYFLGVRLIWNFLPLYIRHFSVDVFVKNRERIRFSLKVGINDLVFSLWLLKKVTDHQNLTHFGFFTFLCTCLSHQHHSHYNCVFARGYKVVKNDIFDLVANRFFYSIFGIFNLSSFLLMMTNHRAFFCKRKIKKNLTT